MADGRRVCVHVCIGHNFEMIARPRNVVALPEQPEYEQDEDWDRISKNEVYDRSAAKHMTQESYAAAVNSESKKKNKREAKKEGKKRVQ